MDAADNNEGLFFLCSRHVGINLQRNPRSLSCINLLYWYRSNQVRNEPNYWYNFSVMPDVMLGLNDKRISQKPLKFDSVSTITRETPTPTPLPACDAECRGVGGGRRRLYMTLLSQGVVRPKGTPYQWTLNTMNITNENTKSWPEPSNHPFVTLPGSGWGGFASPPWYGLIVHVHVSMYIWYGYHDKIITTPLIHYWDSDTVWKMWG